MSQIFRILRTLSFTSIRFYSASVFLALAAFILITGCSQTSRASGPVEITIDATQDVYPFRSTMRGVAMNNWNWIWGGIAERDSERRAALIEATRQLDPGVIRFAGGLWANSVGWDRNDEAPVDGEWTFTDIASRNSYQYQHAYKPAMIDSYADFVHQVGAETIIQINLCDDNPRMWADLAHYTNIENDYAFRYWELGNEIDLNRCISPIEYAYRFVEYSAALKAVDPNIEVMGPSVSMPTRTGWIDTLTEIAIDELDVLAFHWYQLTEWSLEPESFEFQAGSPEGLLSHRRGVGEACQRGFACPGELMDQTRLNRITYRRSLVEAANIQIVSPLREQVPDLPVAITEMGPHATLHENPINGNHIAAIWLADMLGRWAYNGLDILTYYSLEDGTTGEGNTRGLLGLDGETALDVRPTFLSEWLYSAHFGDMMVESTTDHWDDGVVAWASRDSNDPNSLKLILINLTGETHDVEMSIAGFQPISAAAYVMASDDPLSLDDPESFSEHTTTINGVLIPDVLIDDPSDFTDTLKSIEPLPVNVGAEFSYQIEPYSVVALTLNS